MKLKKDWSLAYFLYYLSWLGYWLIGISFFTLIASGILISDGYTRIFDIPVTLQTEQFNAYNDMETEGIKIHIPQSIHTSINLTADTSKSKPGIFFLFAIKFLDGFVVFLTLFLLSRVLKKVAEKDPFYFKNPSYLQTIGWVLIAAGFLSIFMIFIPIPLLHDFKYLSALSISNLNLNGDFYLLAGILTIVISYVFKEGARIYEEQKLTV